ncbi:hypothetical protein [Photobacterium rosenbergii]|uniref:hypothetical protein n=1 Tax=Photobacterium rosenbergii TaxID=294936 RepID=UPI001C98FAB0|nr:hypothetical protein [Photobacterium rosenbergii]MBY5944772.1 hypothetical protein [Photobacterium rosenbergii]
MKLKLSALALIVSTALVGCGGGGGGSNSSDTKPTVATEQPSQPAQEQGKPSEAIPSFTQPFADRMLEKGFTMDEINRICSPIGDGGTATHCLLLDNGEISIEFFGTSLESENQYAYQHTEGYNARIEVNKRVIFFDSHVGIEAKAGYIVTGYDDSRTGQAQIFTSETDYTEVSSSLNIDRYPESVDFGMGADMDNDHYSGIEAEFILSHAKYMINFSPIVHIGQIGGSVEVSGNSIAMVRTNTFSDALGQDNQREMWSRLALIVGKTWM